MNRITPLSTVILTAIIALLFPVVCPATSSQMVIVPMRDGVKLATDIHLPDGEGPWPTILVMTPYNKKGVEGFAAETGKRGYALVAQDFRGRFASEGEDYPVFLSCGWGEHQDGYDTVEWIAAQKWSNGKVGGWGISAPGIALNMTAPSRPPHLTCCYVGVAFSNMYTQSAYQGGAFRKGLLEDWLAQSKFTPKNLELFRAHPNYDDFWKALDPERVAAQVNVPTMFLGGWYDIFTAGTLNSFVTINKQGGEAARGKCRLVMEPYGHGRSDDLVFPNANHPPAADMWNWFDIWLKNDGKGIEQIPAVQYFVMGDPADPNTLGNKWKTAEDWPVPAQMVAVYLHTDNKLRLQGIRRAFRLARVQVRPEEPGPDGRWGQPDRNQGPQGPAAGRGAAGRAAVHLARARQVRRDHRTRQSETLGLLHRPRHRLHGQALRRLPRRAEHDHPRRHPPGQPSQLDGEQRADGAGQDLRDRDRPVVHELGRQSGPPRPGRDLLEQFAPFRAQPQHGQARRRRRQDGSGHQHDLHERQPPLPHPAANRRPPGTGEEMMMDNG